MKSVRACGRVLAAGSRGGQGRECQDSSVRRPRVGAVRAQARGPCPTPVGVDVAIQADAAHLPGLECVAQHQPLGLCVGARPHCRSGQPCVADVAGVVVLGAVARVTARPAPALQVPEPRRADDHAALDQDRGVWDCAAGVSPGERCVDVLPDLGGPLRYRAPGVECAADAAASPPAWWWSRGSRRISVPTSAPSVIGRLRAHRRPGCRRRGRAGSSFAPGRPGRRRRSGREWRPGRHASHPRCRRPGGRR
jgi:hypothetical protein